MENWKKIATVQPVHSKDVTHSRVGLGFEKLDRDAFDPEKAYDKAAALGAKWIRIQSGWAKTEKSRGVYDFEWLDRIVNNLLRRGLEPWMCLCYGNGLYTATGREVFGAVGCVPNGSDEEKQAWHRYVSAVTAHYKNRVKWYEVWNEPDGVWCWKHGTSGTEYGEFVIATAAAVREGDPEAKVIGGSTCCGGLGWLTEVFETGAGSVMDALTYHAYDPNEYETFDRVRSITALCKSYNPAIKIIQGETGAQSDSRGAGAMSGAGWTPERQAKFLARHMISDFFHDIMFASYFSCLDMAEALKGKVGDKASYMDYGYFGLLAAKFDENGMATGVYEPKPSYFTMQTVSSVFREDFSVEPLPIQIMPGLSKRTLTQEPSATDLISGGFRKPNGSAAFVYWKKTNLLTETYDGTVSLDFSNLPPDVKLVDMVTGAVYEIPEDRMEKTGKNSRTLKNIPLLDSPLLLTFGNFIG